MTSLHQVIVGYLLQRRYPIHFYVEFLMYICRGAEELNFDTLQNVNAKLLPVNSYGAVTVPCDFLAECGVYLPNGQYKVPLAPRAGLTRLNNFDTDGSKIPYNNYDISFYGASRASLNDYPSFNDFGEQTGRHFGNRGDGIGSYKYIQERGEIQINAYLRTGGFVLLEYISNGCECDNATKVDPYAIATLEAYMNWKHKENGRTYNESERNRAQRQYVSQHQILRGRKGPGLSEIRALFSRNSHGAPK